MENNDILTPEERRALGLEEDVKQPEFVVPSQQDHPAKIAANTQPVSIAQAELSAEEIARQKMLASFGQIPEDMAPVMQAKTVPPTEVNLEELLGSLTIDVNNVTILDKPSASALADNSIRINGKGTFETICNQSGYAAYMQSLKYSDLSAMENSVGGFYAGRQRLYKTIYSKINTTSVGRVDYATFLKMTSLYDIPSLLYGIYCQTFKQDVEFKVTCPHCGEEINIKVPNKGLILMRNEETYKNVGEIMGNFSHPDQILEKSLLNTRVKTVKKKKKMLFEIKIPSLYKYLNVIGSINPDKFEELQDILGLAVFVDKIYKLDMATLIKEKKVAYYEVKDLKEQFKIISNLEVEDAKEIQKLIVAETEKYAIEYAIKGMNCSHCKKEIATIPVDMEELTFFRIRQM